VVTARNRSVRVRGALTLLLLIALPAAHWSGAVAQAADGLGEKQQQLKSLRERIAAIQNDVTSKQGRKSQAEEAVREVEQDIGRTVADIRNIDGQLSGLSRNLRQLRDDLAARQAALAAQQDRLVGEIRAAYAMGRQRQVKLLLNQQQPAQMGRALTYFGYLGQARAASLSQTRQALESLHDLQAEIERKTFDLNAMRAKADAQRRNLDARMRARQTVVARLDRELRDRGGELTRLQGDEDSLKKLIGSLMEALARVPAEHSERPAFQGVPGKLGWPARGRLTQRFGAPLEGTGFSARGVFIETGEGDTIHAIASGRVAFADWLRGFGLLVILDHGNGFMSLYGHNQAIYKGVGDWVGKDEVIAAAGRSGGYSTPGLYFELRKSGKPVDPLAWCSGTPGAG